MMTTASQPHYLVLEQKLRHNATLLRLWLLSGGVLSGLAAALL